MESGEKDKAASGAAGDGRMLTFELEAAEALAGLSRYSAVRPPSQPILADSQDQGMGVQQFSGNKSATVVVPMNNTKNSEAAVGQTFSKRGWSKVCRSLKQKLTQDEKEAQRISRVLANRESARRTIRRRQTMYMELMGKAANLMEENMYLTKEKELVMKKYNYLKDKNEFLKAEMAKRKMSEAGERGEDRSNPSGAEIPTAATATTSPFFVYNHPSFVPFFWPPIVPCSDMLSSQHTSNPNGTHTREKPCSDQGQEGPGGGISTNSGTPLFLLPVPWLLPCLTQVGNPQSHPGVKRKNEASRIHQCRTCSSAVTHIQEDNHHQLSSNRNVRQGAFRHGFLEKNRGRPLIPPPRKLKNALAESEARIKRKESMRLKNRCGGNSHTQ